MLIDPRGKSGKYFSAISRDYTGFRSLWQIPSIDLLVREALNMTEDFRFNVLESTLAIYGYSLSLRPIPGTTERNEAPTFLCFHPFISVIQQLLPFGNPPKKFIMSISSGELRESPAPAHSRKNNAVAIRSSMYARCIPRQTRAPAPKAAKADLCSCNAYTF